MDSVVLLGIMGSVASIASLLISAPTITSRIIHAVYGFLIVMVVGSAFIFNQEKISELATAEQKASELQAEIDQMNSIKIGAKSILENKSYYSTSDVGENRGFILSAFAFLEQHKSTFPESYQIAKTLLIDGLNIVESAGYYGTESTDEQKRMRDGADAMRELLEGIAAGQT